MTAATDTASVQGTAFVALADGLADGLPSVQDFRLNIKLQQVAWKKERYKRKRKQESARLDSTSNCSRLLGDRQL